MREPLEPGRLLVEDAELVQEDALPVELRIHGRELTELGLIYKQINAPFGQLSFDVLAASTRALASGSSTDDSTYAAISDRIAALTAHRDTLAGQMRDVLNGAAFGGQRYSRSQLQSLTMEGNALLMQAHQLGAASSP